MKSPFARLATPITVAFTTIIVAACGSGGGAGSGPQSSFDGSVPGDGGPLEDGSLLHDGGGNESGSLIGNTDATTGGDSGGSTNHCVPKTCVEIGASCGPQGDGCGNLIQCGNCKAPETCGGGGTQNVCGGSGSLDGGTCKPKTCADWNATCGPVSDGCGGLVQCGNCAAPTTCGGGGTPSQCGGNNGCVPIASCAAAGVGCGPVGDGCGGLIQCGSCTPPQTCGGATHGQCGVPTIPDTGISCTPNTCAGLGINCGPAGDGCGGVLDCGTCTVAGQTCGGGGTPSVCGGNSGCVPKTCADLAISCGPAGDGCGGVLQCGSCTAPQTCGGGGTPGVCGGFNACVPKTCAQLGFDCGPAGDGCGGLLQCGSCTAPAICGGGVQAGVCGPTADAGTSGCTGLCQQQQTCPGSNVTTTVSGKVLAPNGTDPVYNALVYVPNGGAAPTYGVTAFSPGVHCGQCGSEVSGAPLVQTLSAVDGTFTLQNVPVGSNIPLVIQVGRWRRKVTIPSVASCVNTALAANYTRLPSSEPGSSTYPPAWYPAGDNDPADNIPLMAFSTGAVDALECVLLKIGVDQSQFSDPAAQGGTGRVRFYTGESPVNAGNSGPGAQFSTKTPSATQLWGGATPDINQYDMVFFPCQGDDDRANVGSETNGTPTTQQTNVINYTNAGGRVFATHYSYVWLFNDNPFKGTATWDVTQGSATSGTGTINTSFARGQALAQWLQIVGASTTYAQMPLNTLRYDFSGVVAPTLLWVQTSALAGTTGPNGNQNPPAPAAPWPTHLTFDTPVGSQPASQCGRVLFDDFHVENTGADTGETFPAECPGGSMTAQEKMLEFMIFDLGSCLLPTTTPPPPTCTPLDCAQQGFNCGPAGDGCGNEIASCGTCTPPATCGGGGTPGVCGGMGCTPTTCTAQGIQCGPAGDGCGNEIQCGNCPNGQTCGGGGVPGKCGKPTCTPTTCAAQGIQCGPAGDGCGNEIQCGNCPPGQTCGGGGPGKCGAPDGGVCQPETCAQENIQCGPAGDGCGGQIDCGPCPAGQTCGGGGVPGMCGKPSCTPDTCASLGLQCGPAGDGCGGVLQCGNCPSNEGCGTCAPPGTCGSCCTPTTCAKLGFNCGPAGDGCGGVLQCGTCTAPNTCGGGGTAGQCGNTMAQ
jgi:hypothetical protein